MMIPRRLLKGHPALEVVGRVPERVGHGVDRIFPLLQHSAEFQGFLVELPRLLQVSHTETDMMDTKGLLHALSPLRMVVQCTFCARQPSQ